MQLSAGLLNKFPSFLYNSFKITAARIFHLLTMRYSIILFT